MKTILTTFIILLYSFQIFSQEINPYEADKTTPRAIEGMKLVWNDEFDDARLNLDNWSYEKGFVRNQELQYYQPSNVILSDGLLVMTAKRDTVANGTYIPESTNWLYNRQYAYYTSGSVKSQNKKSFLYGRFEIRARIDTTKGSWPAIWTKGNVGNWPTCGEIDILEFYISGREQVFLANVIFGAIGAPKFTGSTKTLAYFLEKDPDFVKKFHVWTEIWDENEISLYLDDELIFSRTVVRSANPTGTKPLNGFMQPHYFTLNLAIGANGGNPDNSVFPIKYEVDYIRVYQNNISAVETQKDNSKLYFSQTDNSLYLQNDDLDKVLSVLDITGRVVLRLENPRAKISLAHLKSGIYITKLTMKSGNALTRKIWKL